MESGGHGRYGNVGKSTGFVSYFSLNGGGKMGIHVFFITHIALYCTVLLGKFEVTDIYD